MPITTAQIYAGLHYAEGARWFASTITVSVPNASPTAFWSPFAYAPGEEPTNPAYGVLDPIQRAAFLAAVDAWDAVIDVNLLEVADDGVSQGDIRIAFTDTADYLDDDTAAYAYQPPQAGFGTAAFQGDIWVDDEFKGDPAQPGDFLYATFLHELGHALGLKHPFEGTVLPAEFDNSRFTVMSYTDFPDSSLRYFTMEGATLFGETFTVQPSTPMLLDVIAMQGVYGAENDTALTSDTWVIDQDAAFMATVHDNGGTDTLDLSDHQRASSINLTPGTYSSVALYPIAAQIADWTAAYPGFADFIASYLNQADTYTWSNNLATTPQTVIENVRAGSGDDTVVGNTAGNSISGGAGSDSILGGQGGDTIVGGASGATWNWLRGEEGDDSLLGDTGIDNINGNQGADTVSTGAGDDFCVGGKDGDLLFGGEGFDYVYGNLGDDSCNGDGGADILRGGQGNDTLAGGAGDDFVSGDLGSDTMTGGAGADLFHAWANSGIDRVLDFNLAEGDRVILDPGTQFTVTQVGGDTVIQMSSAQVILVGVAASSLPAGAIFGF